MQLLWIGKPVLIKLSEQNRVPMSKSSVLNKILVSLLLLTAFLVVVKIRFEHYNLLFPIVLIFILAIILKKCKVSRNYRFFFLALLAINFLCLAIPDRAVYILQKRHRYFWSEEPLKLSHFKIKENVENDTAAMTNPVIIGKINRVYNYPSAVLFTSDYIGSSWIDTTFFDSSKEGREALKVLLEHEKLHFDIMEIFTKKAQDSLDKMIFYPFSEKYKVVDYFLEAADSLQDRFDYETNHGTLIKENQKWDTMIKQELKKL